MSHAQPKRNKRRKTLSVGKKLAFSLISTGVFLACIELVLAILGVRPKGMLDDPFVGFAGSVSVLEEVRDRSDAPMMVTRPSKLVWFNEQSFPRNKPPNTRRVFCVGGSTTFGRPYSDLTSYSGWLRELLPIADDSSDWEVINAGGVSYASYRVAAVMEELARYEPDLFVVYSAHNEFLERRTYANMFNRPPLALRFQSWLRRTRTFTAVDWIVGGAKRSVANWQQPQIEILPAEVEERLNRTVGPVDYIRDSEWESKVLRHYEVNLRRMIRIARRVGAKILFIAPAANEKDCSPFKSEVGHLSQLGRDGFDEMVQAAFGSEAEGQIDQAIALWNQAKLISPQHAEVRYRLGKALFASGQYAEAQAEFASAINEDVCSLRAIDEIKTLTHEVTERAGVPVVEFENRLREKCLAEFGHGCLGEEYFLDHVHPTLDVHRELAMWVIDEMDEAGILARNRLESDESQVLVEQIGADIMARIDVEQHGIALRNLAKVFHWSGKFEEAAPRASDALELLPNDAESRLVLADCLKNMGEPGNAIIQYEILLSDHPDYTRAFLPFGELLVADDRHDEAMHYLLSALLADPSNAYAYYTLGKLHVQREEWAMAVEVLQKADQLYPDDSNTRVLLKQSRQRLAEQQAGAGE